MYPDEERLVAVGRVAIAAARLDGQLAWLLSQLDQDLDWDAARRKHGYQLRDAIRLRAGENLKDDLLTAVISATEDAYRTLDERHLLLHGEWILRGSEGMVPASAIIDATAQELDALMKRSVASPKWQHLHARTQQLGPAPDVDVLDRLRITLETATVRVANLVFAVASAREVGRPPGWVTGP